MTRATTRKKKTRMKTTILSSADSDFPWTEEEYEHLFDSDSDCEKEEFYGFTEEDVAMGQQ